MSGQWHNPDITADKSEAKAAAELAAVVQKAEPEKPTFDMRLDPIERLTMLLVVAAIVVGIAIGFIGHWLDLP